MIETIAKLFSTLSSAAQTAKVVQSLLKGIDGDRRALLEEIKENAGLCWLVVGREVEPTKIIYELSTEEYDRLLRTDFDFNELKKNTVRANPEFSNSDLEVYADRDTANLLEDIYDSIKEMKRIHRIDENTDNVMWQLRIFHCHKRILLLLDHLNDYKTKLEEESLSEE